VTRLFYTLLYLLTVLFAAIQWTDHDAREGLFSFVGARKASAQTPNPFGGGVPGDPNVNFRNPNPVPNAEFPVQPTGRPLAGWPGGPPPGAPLGPLSNTPPPGAPTPLPGTSISNVSLDRNANAIPLAPQQTPTVGRTGAPWPAAIPRIPSTQRIAIVGQEFILAGEVMGPIDEKLAENADLLANMPPEMQYEQWKRLVWQRLEPLLQTKMIVSDAKRKVPPEGLNKIMEKLGEIFEEQELPNAMKKAGAKNRTEMEEVLAKTGSSIDREKFAFSERMMALDWVRQQVKTDEVISHQQMVDYYHEHLADYEHLAKVRWEQLIVRFDKYPSKPDAYRALAEAGNRVVRGEIDFTTMASELSNNASVKSSQLLKVDLGSTAVPSAPGKSGKPPEKEKGEWTNKGSFASDELERILFTLPIGQMSPTIIEDDRSFRIVRVLERVEAGRTPFNEVQEEIKKKIKADRNSAAIQKYVETLKGKASVWTIFDDGPLMAKEPKLQQR
jgi:hypothetical protein